MCKKEAHKGIKTKHTSKSERKEYKHNEGMYKYKATTFYVFKKQK